MNVQSYTVIHYGADYIGSAIMGVYDNVDKVNVFYGSTPAHGTGTNIECPEQLKDIVEAVYSIPDPDNKIALYKTPSFRHEGEQRDWAVWQCVQFGADLIVVLDYDEMWTPESLQRSIKHVWDAGSHTTWLVNMTHMWRSFWWACKDEGWPVRLIDTRQLDVGPKYLQEAEVYHFGYAIKDVLMQYKWKIHGHINELRHDWFTQRWAAWPPEADCHPTNKNFWTPEPFDAYKLPDYMHTHKWFEQKLTPIM